MRTEVKADSANRTAALAPAFSLAPEVPGIAAADITARQLWWFATVASAGIAMWLFALCFWRYLAALERCRNPSCSTAFDWGTTALHICRTGTI